MLSIGLLILAILGVATFPGPRRWLAGALDNLGVAKDIVKQLADEAWQSRPVRWLLGILAAVVILGIVVAPAFDRMGGDYRWIGAAIMLGIGTVAVLGAAAINKIPSFKILGLQADFKGLSRLIAISGLGCIFGATLMISFKALSPQMTIMLLCLGTGALAYSVITDTRSNKAYKFMTIAIWLIIGGVVLAQAFPAELLRLRLALGLLNTEYQEMVVVRSTLLFKENGEPVGILDEGQPVMINGEAGQKEISDIECVQAEVRGNPPVTLESSIQCFLGRDEKGVGAPTPGDDKTWTFLMDDGIETVNQVGYVWIKQGDIKALVLAKTAVEKGWYAPFKGWVGARDLTVFRPSVQPPPTPEPATTPTAPDSTSEAAPKATPQAVQKVGPKAPPESMVTSDSFTATAGEFTRTDVVPKPWDHFRLGPINADDDPDRFIIECGGCGTDPAKVRSRSGDTYLEWVCDKGGNNSLNLPYEVRLKNGPDQTLTLSKVIGH